MTLLCLVKSKKKFCLFISSKFVKIVGSTYKHRTLPLSLFCTDEEYKFKRKNLLSRPQRILAKSWFKTQKTYKKLLYMVKHTSSLLCIVNVTILYVTSQQQKTVFSHT